MSDLGSGFRAMGSGVVHDVDDKTHAVAVDFPTDGVTLDGYASSWSPHVFAESFRADPHPEMVFDHKRGVENVIGRALRSESLSDRARLVGGFEPFDRKPRARQAFDEIRSGRLPGFSFEFDGGQFAPVSGRRGAVRYVQARMKNFGPVYRPAIPGARHIGIRSQDPLWAAMERVCARLGVYGLSGVRSEGPGLESEVARVRALLDGREGAAICREMDEWNARQAVGRIEAALERAHTRRAVRS